MGLRIIFSAVISLAASWPTVGYAQQSRPETVNYRVTRVQLDASPDATNTEVLGRSINNNGSVIGTLVFYPQNGSPEQRAFVTWPNTRTTVLGDYESEGISLNNNDIGIGNNEDEQCALLVTPRGASCITLVDPQSQSLLPTQVIAINNNNKLLLSSGEKYYIYDAITNEQEILTDISFTPTGFNSSGIIIGYRLRDEVINGVRSRRAYYSVGGVTNVVPVPVGSHSILARAVNDKGIILATTYLGNIYSPSTLSSLTDGATTTPLLPLAGGQYSDGIALNNLGQVVGTASDGLLVRHPVIWNNGIPRRLEQNITHYAGDPSPSGLVPVAINDRGQILVRGYEHSYSFFEQTYILTPIPTSITPGNAYR